MLSMRDVSTSYGQIKAIRDISIDVPEGKIVGLIGANGAGKTTTMKTIAGLLKPEKGTITFEGKRVDGWKPYRLVQAGLALVPEGRAILGQMTVLENLEMGAYQRKDPAGVKQDLEKMMTWFPILRERIDQLGGTMSGGQQQMLAIARALMSRPKLLLLDEPSMGLAPIVVSEIFRTIKEINREGTTILIVEQNVKQVLKIADYGYVLEAGRIVYEGDGKSLLNDEKVTEAYLGGKKHA
ncbi:ABC transporter ATP-binding protein [Brevibacillus sp. B_LB10_24]|uniref:ABC transporter ATP-binding protein n=1 Tax=Brevibacillus sp. B_LB10_24 TaxID=3380645 RepID=UPI0038BD6D79